MFKTVKLLRGFNEIEPFWELTRKYDSTICGGYARYCASPLKTSDVIHAGDVDIFPHSSDKTQPIVDELKKMGFEIKHENEVSITMKTTTPELMYLPVPQIIKPVIEGAVVTLGTTEEILENFDFTVVRAGIISPKEVMVDEDFEEHESKKILCLKNIHCPISSLLRCCKYARKGYWMKPTEALKLFNDWMDRGDDYRIRINELFKTSFSSLNGGEEMSKEDIDELERLLRID